MRTLSGAALFVSKANASYGSWKKRALEEYAALMEDDETITAALHDPAAQAAFHTGEAAQGNQLVGIERLKLYSIGEVVNDRYRMIEQMKTTNGGQPVEAAQVGGDWREKAYALMESGNWFDLAHRQRLSSPEPETDYTKRVEQLLAAYSLPTVETAAWLARKAAGEQVMGRDWTTGQRVAGAMERGAAELREFASVAGRGAEEAELLGNLPRPSLAVLKGPWIITSRAPGRVHLTAKVEHEGREFKMLAQIYGGNRNKKEVHLGLLGAEGHTFHMDSSGFATEYGPGTNALEASGIRALIRKIKEIFPEAETLSYERVGGRAVHTEKMLKTRTLNLKTNKLLGIKEADERFLNLSARSLVTRFLSNEIDDVGLRLQYNLGDNDYRDEVIRFLSSRDVKTDDALRVSRAIRNRPPRGDLP